IIRRVFAPMSRDGDRGIPRFTPRVLLSVPPSVPRRTGRALVVAHPPMLPSPSLHRLGIRIPTQVDSRVGSVTRLQSSLYVTARTVARPPSTRAFTFELSSHESPHWNVEYNYAGNQPISRGRSFTGWTRSITGCEQSTRRTQRKRRESPEIAVRSLRERYFTDNGDKSFCRLNLCVLRVLCGEKFRSTKPVAKMGRFFRFCD